MIRKKKFIRGVAILCVIFLSGGNIHVYAEEHDRQTAYEHEETILAEEADDEHEEEIIVGIEENVKENNGSEEKTITNTEENEFDASGLQANPKEDVVKQEDSKTNAIVLNADKDLNVDGLMGNTDKLEQEVEPEEDAASENMNKEEVPEEMDGDPQNGTSMSNIEKDFRNTAGDSSRSRAFVRNTYVHNSRYNTGYDIINGIDVSYHNGSINWSAVKSSGINYAIIRVGFRGYGSSGSLNEDIRFKENIKGALDAGLKVGVYFFSQAISQEEAIEEATYVLKRISRYNITLPVVIDFEYASNSSGKLIGRLYNANLSRSRATSVCRSFCKTIESAGYSAMVYANRSMLESDLYADDLSSQYKIWLANYTTRTGYTGDYYAWQYTSSGSINGISGYVDCNFFYEKKNVSVNLTDAQEYVKKLYRELLGREADINGLNIHSSAIAEGRYTASDIALVFVNSGEFISKNYSDQKYVEKLYQALLNRNAVSEEISGWVNALGTGVSRRYILAQFTNSGEFANVCKSLRIPQGNVQVVENRDKNPAATAYVSRCYLNILGRAADPTGLNTWTGKILSGNSGTEIVKDLAVSAEFSDKRKTDSEFIDMLYKAMLGRNADIVGKKHWLDCLREGVSYVYVINGFSGSAEFRELCASYGIVAGAANITEARDKNIGVTGFVNRNYTTILGRNGEAAGLNYWCNVIIDKARTPAQVAYGFVFSQEAKNKKLNNSDFVEMLYESFLGRKSDPAGKLHWLSALESGQTRERVFWGFANSGEFQSIIASYGL